MSKKVLIADIRFLVPLSPSTAVGWNFRFSKVPLEQMRWSKAAAELSVAVGPFLSLP